MPTDPEKLAGGFWPFGKPDAFGARAIDAWEFLAMSIEAARRAIADGGLDSEPFLTQPRLEAMEASVAPNSREAVALSLWAAAQSVRPILDMATGSGGNRFALDVAGRFANIGMMYAILQSMPVLTDGAAVGRKHLRDRQAGADAVNGPRRQQRARQKAKAVEFAKGELQYDPPEGRGAWTPALLAEQVISTWPDGEPRPATSTVATYLREALAEGALSVPD